MPRVVASPAFKIADARRRMGQYARSDEGIIGSALINGAGRRTALSLEAAIRCESIGQIRSQSGGVAQVGMAHRLLLLQPGMGQYADASR